MIVERMKLELPRHVLAHGDAAHAVALGVDRGRIDADPDLPWDRGDDAARYAALGRHADFIGPLASIVDPDAGRAGDLAPVRRILGKSG